MKDEYEYVSDDGELKIDEFPIRRKKNTTKRELPCKIVSSFVQAIALANVPSSHTRSNLGAQLWEERDWRIVLWSCTLASE